MPRALITGATGQDGSYLAERFLADGWSVTGTARATRQDGEQEFPSGIERMDLDLADTAAITEIVERTAPDVVVNLAGVSSVARSWEDPVETALVTGVAVSALLEACWQRHRAGHGIRFVQASSAEIFGANPPVPQDEATPIAPSNPYGAAKAYAHHMVGLYRNRGLHSSAAILYNHESPRRPPTFVTRKITQAVAEIARGRLDSLALGNLDARRDWGWAPDYVDALALMARAETPGDYVIATGEARSVREFVAAAFTAAGIGEWEDLVTVDPRFQRPTDAGELRGDATKAREQLGWRATMPFAEIVAHMVRADLDALDAGA
jgi:GDPmannose 4,6-dehydratase